MTEQLIEIHNDIQDLITQLNSLGFDDQRSAIQSLVDALYAIDNYIEESKLGEEV